MNKFILKKIIAILFLIILFFSCKKENEFFLYKTQKLDSLLIKISKSNNKKYKLKNTDSIYKNLKLNKLDSITRNKFLKLADIYVSLNDKKYIEIANLLISNPSNPINIKEISYCNTLLGNYYYNLADYEKSYFYFNIAENSYKKLNDIESISYIKLSKANILTFKNDFIGAEKLAVSVLKTATIQGYDIIKYNCYITLGNALTGLNNYEKAIQYYQKAIDTAENLKPNANYRTYKIQSINYISIVYQKQKQYNNAIKFAQKGLNLIVNKSDEILFYTYLTNNLAYSKFKLGDKTSVNQFLETLKIGDSLKSAPIQITSKTHLGEYYLAQKDTLKANIYLKAAQIQAHQNNIFEDELAILQLLAKANPKKDTFYSARYISLNDSLQNVERATRDKFARIEFETDEITTEKNNLTVEKEVLSDQRWIIIGFSVFSIVIIVLWFKNKSQKAKTRELLLKQEQQKANEEIYQLMLDQQQKIQEGKNLEKQRISLELHDGVMGKLSAVRLNLYASLYKANLIEEEIFSKQIDEIQAVEQEIRTIAHDLNSSLFSDNSNFIAIVKELFAKIENHSQIQFTLNVSDAVNWDLINNTIKINLYRILQEALQNIEKYADAKKVAVVMTKTEKEEITVSISDDGNGFNTNQKKDGIGIKNMKTRMAELNGTFAMESQLNKGTKINLIIPF